MSNDDIAAKLYYVRGLHFPQKSDGEYRIRSFESEA